MLLPGLRALDGYLDAQQWYIGNCQPIHAREPALEPEKKARNLLFRLLTPEQQKEYKSTGEIWLSIGELRYKLGDRLVRVYDKAGELLETWCVYCPNGPHDDTLVAQILFLRADPAELRRHAVVTPHGIMRIES